MLDVRLLGPVEAAIDGTLVQLGGTRQRALLAYLALRRNKVVDAADLVARIWGEDSPDTSLNTLQVYVGKLRKVVEPDRERRGAGSTLVTRPPGYVLHLDETDADRFESAAAAGHEALSQGRHREASTTLSGALELWRGPALADLMGYLFVHGPALRLEELRLTALEDRVEADIALGRSPTAAAELEALIRAHPHRERLAELSMLALYRSGRQADALRTFQRARQSLVDDLGLEPGPRLRQLEQAILGQDPALDGPQQSAEPVVVEPSTSVDVSVEPVAPPATEPVRRHRAPITVVHVRDGDAASLVALDPEAATAPRLLEAADTLRSFGATILRCRLSVVEAAFGWDGARPDDAHRALIAAIDLVATSHVRATVASGDALLPADDGGDVASLATRLAQIAASEGVVADRLTIERCRARVHASPVGDAFLVTGVATGSPAHHRFVGRLGELELLDLVVRQVCDRHVRQLIAVTGPPGIGKSRFVTELLDRWPHIRAARTFTAPDRHGDSLGVLRALLDAIAGAPPTEEITTIAAAAHALHEAVLADAHPLLIAIDDADRLPPAALDTVVDTHAALAGVAVVLVLSGAQLSVGSTSSTVTVALDGLAEPEAAELVRDALPGSDPHTVDGIVARCGGNPLLLEALACTSGAGPVGELPPSAQLALRAWIDRVHGDDARLLGYIGASPDGLEFDEVLQLRPGLDRSATQEAVLRLQRSDLLVRSVDDGRLRPRHRLLGAAAFARLGREDRVDALAGVARLVGDPGSAAQLLVDAASLQRDANDPAWLATADASAQRARDAAWSALRSGDAAGAAERLLAAVSTAWVATPSQLWPLALLGLLERNRPSTRRVETARRPVARPFGVRHAEPAALLDVLDDDRGLVVRAAWRLALGQASVAHSLLDRVDPNGLEPRWAMSLGALRQLLLASAGHGPTGDRGELSAAAERFRIAQRARAAAEPGALAAWEEALTAVPPTVPPGPLHMYAAMAGAMHGHLDTAAEHLDQAVAPAPSMSEYPIARAWLRLRRGDPGARDAAMVAVGGLIADHPVIVLEARALAAACGDQSARGALERAGEAGWLAVIDGAITT